MPNLVLESPIDSPFENAATVTWNILWDWQWCKKTIVSTIMSKGFWDRCYRLWSITVRPGAEDPSHQNFSSLLRSTHQSINQVITVTDRQYGDSRRVQRDESTSIVDEIVKRKFDAGIKPITILQITMVNKVHSHPFYILRCRTKRSCIGTAKEVGLTTRGVTERIGCL